MKKTVCLILSLLICLALLPAGALAAEELIVEEEPVLDGGPTMWEIHTETYIVNEDSTYTPGGGLLVVSHTIAEPGDYITYAATPDDGYRLLSVTYGNGVTGGTDITGTTGFYMENYRVFVTALFEKAEPYTIVSGGNGTWTKGSGVDYQIAVESAVHHDEAYLFFMQAEIDGSVLQEGPDYTYTSGAVTVTFRKSLLEKLEPGIHDVTIRFADGSVDTLLAVSKGAKPVITIGSGNIAQITGDFSDLYARAAIVVDNYGQSGLIVAQATINPDGTIVIPVFEVPGLTVLGVNLALVPTVGDIPVSTPNIVASKSLFYT